MSLKAALRSLFNIFELWFANLRRPEQFLVNRVHHEIDSSLTDPQDWDSYWSGMSYRKESPYEGTLYELVAGIYRRSVIKRNLNTTIQREFPSHSRLLHAGCGSGQVDADLQSSMNITALDISASALHRYARNNPRATAIKHGDIFKLPFSDSCFEGVYNLGVMEHFTHDQILNILSEFHRVLEPDGKIVLFWPHARSTSVLVFHLIHFVMNAFFKQTGKLHPAEISLMQSKKQAITLLSESGFNLISYKFGINDFFVQTVIVGKKSESINTL